MDNEHDLVLLGSVLPRAHNAAYIVCHVNLNWNCSLWHIRLKIFMSFVWHCREKMNTWEIIAAVGVYLQVGHDSNQ